MRNNINNLNITNILEQRKKLIIQFNKKTVKFLMRLSYDLSYEIILTRYYLLNFLENIIFLNLKAT